MHIALVSSPKKSINFVRGHEIDKKKPLLLTSKEVGYIFFVLSFFILNHKYHSFEIKISKESI